MKYISLFLTLFFMASVFAQQAPEKIRRDQVQIGASGSVDNKYLIFDTGDGAGNPKLSVDQTSREFSFTKNLNVVDDLLKLGDGTNGASKVLEFDNGSGASNKKLTVDTSSNGSFNVNDLTIGDGATSNKQFIFDIGGGAANPRFKWNQSTGKLQLSNDGTLFKSIGSGSGSGSGINLLSDYNGDCEAGTPPTSWTESGGSFTAETSSPANGTQSCSWNPSTSAQTLKSALITHPAKLESQTCTVNLVTQLASGTEGDIEVYVEDSSLNKLSRVINVPISTTWEPMTIVYTCPDASTQTRLVFESTTDASALKFDDVELGQSNLTEVSQAELFGTAYWPVTANCNYASSSATFAGTLDTDCTTVPTVSGGLESAGTQYLKIGASELPAGKYVFSLQGTFYTETGTTCSYQFSDGTNTTKPLQLNALIQVAQLQGVFEYSTAQANKTFELQMKRISGAGFCRLGNDSTDRDVKLNVEYFPVSTVRALSAKNGSAFLVDAVISGANLDLGTGNVASATEITNASLSIAKSSFSRDVEIACASGNASTGTTCSSSNESLGFAVDVDKAGSYFTCLNFPNKTSLAVSSGLNNTFTLVETNNTDTTVLQTASTKFSSLGSGTNTIPSRINPINACGVFNFSSVGKKTIRLEYTQAVSGTVSESLIYDSGIRVTMFRLGEDLPGLFSLELQNTLNSKLENNSGSTMGFYSAYVTYSAGTPILTGSKGSWIDSLTDNGTGDFTINVTPGVFSSAPFCTATAQASTSRGTASIYSAPTTSTVRVKVWDTSGTAADGFAFVNCIGEK